MSCSGISLGFFQKPSSKLQCRLKASTGTQGAVVMLIMIMLCGYVEAGIHIFHKSSQLLDVTHEFRSFGFKAKDELVNKTFLVVAEPISGCASVKAPPNVELYSIKNDNIGQPQWILLVDDSDCDFHLKIVLAQLKGYSGIIVYSLKSNEPAPMNIENHYKNLYSINVSFVGHEDGIKLKQYKYSPVSKKYIVKIERDKSGFEIFSEACMQFFNRCLSSLQDSPIMKLSNNFALQIRNYVSAVFPLLFQLFFLLSPVGFLLLHNYCWWKTETRSQGQRFENVFEEQSRSHQSYDENRNDWDSDNSVPSYSTQNSLKDHRKLLGVSENATKAEIDSAFRKKSTLYHPDKNRNLSNQEMERKSDVFKQMNKAREELVKYC